VRTIGQVEQILAAWQACERRLKSTNSLVLINNVQDVKDQLAELVPAGFVTRTGLRRLPDLMRYLVAADRRLQQMPTNVQRDTTRMEKVHEMRDEYAWLLEQFPRGLPVPRQALDIRWLIEELRVSLWAQQLTTAQPVSVQRVERALSTA
jgi:ATP-dependent RNA helicase HrpA